MQSVFYSLVEFVENDESKAGQQATKKYELLTVYEKAF